MLLVMALKKWQEGHHRLLSVFLQQNIELHYMYTLDNPIVISCTETLFLKQAFSAIKIEWRCLRQQQKPLEGEQVNKNLKFWLCWNLHMSKETWNLPTRVMQSFHCYSMFIFSQGVRKKFLAIVLTFFSRNREKGGLLVFVQQSISYCTRTTCRVLNLSSPNSFLLKTLFAPSPLNAIYNGNSKISSPMNLKERPVQLSPMP